MSTFHIDEKLEKEIATLCRSISHGGVPWTTVALSLLSDIEKRAQDLKDAMSFAFVPADRFGPNKALDMANVAESHSPLRELIEQIIVSLRKTNHHLCNFKQNPASREIYLHGVPKIVVDQARQAQRIISDIYQNPKVLSTIDSRAFEELIAELMRAQGFELELTKRTRDGGFDIIALKYLDKHNPLKLLVECKRYSDRRPVGVEVVRSFKEVVTEQGANRGLLVASSYFTHGAKEKIKKSPYLLDYKDRDQVIEWIHDYYHSQLKEYSKTKRP